MRIVSSVALAWVLAMAAVSAGESGTLIPNRLSTAQVGEWVLFQLPGGYTQKHMVVERTGDGEDANITVRVDDILDGKVTQTREVVEIAGPPTAPMPSPKDPGAVATVRDEEVVVKGKKFKALAVDVKKDGALLRTWYISPDFPVYGLIKRTEDKGNEPSFEAIDFSAQ